MNEYLIRVILILFSVGSIVYSSFFIHTTIRHPLRYTYCGTDYFDNIGYEDVSNDVCYPVIDAVYTWVNGSDPEWLKEMLFYKEKWNKSHNISISPVDDQAASLNRFRDNDELKLWLGI